MLTLATNAPLPSGSLGITIFVHQTMLPATETPPLYHCAKEVGDRKSNFNVPTFYPLPLMF
jgi:hypothetical protein